MAGSIGLNCAPCLADEGDLAAQRRRQRPPEGEGSETKTGNESGKENFAFRPKKRNVTVRLQSEM
jgi:hypothetical protein